MVSASLIETRIDEAERRARFLFESTHVERQGRGGPSALARRARKRALYHA